MKGKKFTEFLLILSILIKNHKKEVITYHWWDMKILTIFIYWLKGQKNFYLQASWAYSKKKLVLNKINQK